MIHRPRSLWIIFKIGMYFWPDNLQFFKAQLSHAQGCLCNEKQVESSVTICSFHMFFWNRILELPLAKPSWSVKFPGSRFLSTQIRKYNLGNLATSLVFRRWSPALTLILRRQLSDSFSAFYNLAVSLHYNKVFIIWLWIFFVLVLCFCGQFTEDLEKPESDDEYFIIMHFTT